jgi:hypothetical protein
MVETYSQSHSEKRKGEVALGLASLEPEFFGAKAH